MTSLLEPVTLVGGTNSLFSVDSFASTHKNRQHRHVLKFKENTFKHKCNRALRRKLKKYKLRQDGGEDQDVLDVSKVLVSSLIIKSPNNSLNEPNNIGGECDEFEELRPKNYLFRMVRKKDVHKYIEKLDLDSSTAMAPNKSDIETNNHIDNQVTQTPEMIESQEKKATDAFKLLMDSRNKSIGGNSPGKEKLDDECGSENIIEKQNVKSKRKLVLQRMAEAKGLLKRKELEEYHEECIKQKMKKRAEKFKSMILNDKKILRNNVENVTSKTDDGLSDNDSKIKKGNLKKSLKKNVKTLQIVDIFNSIEDPVVISVETKHVSNEDEEFLSKLSPSLKKKESMLSYFKKLDKVSDDPNDNLIKVKLGSKTKKKSKKKKLTLNKNTLSIGSDENLESNQDVNQDTPVSTHLEEKVTNNNQRQKRKRDTSVSTKKMDIISEPIMVSENRPKRSVKKPVKYLEDAYLSSSDEELHIFTPKKKKRAEAVSECKQSKEKLDKNIKSLEPLKPKPEKKVKDKEPQRPVKLAPIFMKQSQVDPEALEAKQKFLQSGVPDKLKKIANHHKNVSLLGSAFSTVVHVQQKEETVVTAEERTWTLPEINVIEEVTFKHDNNTFKKLLNTTTQQVDSFVNHDPHLKLKTHLLLHTLKELYPKFPVYRTYHHLKSRSKGEFNHVNHVDLDNSIEIINGIVDATNDSPDRLTWTDKFKALSTNQIIGNFDSIKELRKWLVSWTENDMRSKTKTTAESDSSDYYQSDTDSRESMKCVNNLLILTGPTGCGKTSSVYAVAAELAMKVIEVNVSSKRTGKIMLQDLQEATQSHKVNRGTGAMDNIHKSQDKTYNDAPKKLKKRGRPKKNGENVGLKTLQVSDMSGTPSSQESVRTDMSLILIDDADIVFEQDDGFSSAIVQLVQSSKRPVILVISSLSCPHLQRFLQNGKILNMNLLLPRMLGIWLDIMCLAENGVCWPGLGAKYLNYFMGDIRKTINYLQFYTSPYVVNSNSEEELASQNIDNFKPNIDDESSSTSWADHEVCEGKKCSNVNMESNHVWKDFIHKQSNLLAFKQPQEIFNIWWSVPSLMGIVTDCDHERQVTKGSVDKLASMNELEAVANVIDAISMADYFGHVKRCAEYNITSTPWYSTESYNVTEQQNLDSYMRSYQVGDEISHSLVSGSILSAQSILCCEKKTNVYSPGMMTHRQKDKIISRHKTLSTFLNPSAVLDRRSLALDYWSSCRTICRIEKTKTDVNVKRKNRFCHYLKSVNVLCKSDTFDNLCNSLCSSTRSELSVTNFNE